MRAQLFNESFPRTPSSALAARPLASGARLSLIGKRCFSNVGLGCPSFGGQRTGGGGSNRLLATLVTGLNRSLPAKRVDVLSVAVRTQTARSAAMATGGVPFARSLPRRSRRSWLGREVQIPRPGLTGESEMQEVSAHQPCASRKPGCSIALLAVSRSGHLLAQCGSPNPSVKGTSCGKPQAAPYVERWASHA